MSSDRSPLRVKTIRGARCGALVVLGVALCSHAKADEVICAPLPADSVRLETFDDGHSIEFHLYFPTHYEGLDVRSALAEFTIGRNGDCKSCEPVRMTAVNLGSRFGDGGVEVFDVIFRLPKNAVSEVDVAAHYSGYCAASMKVRINTAEPGLWPARLTPSGSRSKSPSGHVEKEN
jgi:hypothetical protein